MPSTVSPKDNPIAKDKQLRYLKRANSYFLENPKNRVFVADTENPKIYFKAVRHNSEINLSGFYWKKSKIKKVE